MLFIALAAALALAPVPAAAQENKEALTLDEVVSLAVRNSPAVLAAEQDINIARQRVREARFLAFPQFTLSGTMSQVDLEYPVVLGPEMGERYLDPSIRDAFYTLRAQALQPLYTGGKNTNMLKLAKASHTQAQVNYEAVKADAALAAKKAFYSLLYQRRLKEACAKWLSLATALNTSMRKDAFEELEASMLLSGLSDKLEQAESGMDAAGTELLKALNREPGYHAEVEGVFEPRPVDEDVTRSLVTAMEARPELKSELFKAQIDDISVNLAMVRRYPTIYLGASYDMNAYRISDMTDNSVRANNWLASVAIRFPLSYDVWTQVQQRRAQQRQGELKRVELQDEVRFEIISAHKESAFWQAEAGRLAAETARAEADYEAALKASRPSMTALRSLCTLCDFEKKSIDAVYNQLLARARLEWARGQDFADQDPGPRSNGGVN